MQVKKYQASTIGDAMNLVRRDIGPDALILSTRKMRDENRGSGSKNFFEITAIPSSNQKNVEPGDVVFDNSASYLKNVQSELMSIKEMMFILSRSRNLMDGFRSNPAAINIYGKLVRSGIAEIHARRFLEKGGVFTENRATSSKEMRKRVLKEILKVINVTDPFNKKGQVIAAFIGPTGVGKTTTLAKLAANLYLKKKKRIGFISIDNYRIAALDQLKTYAGILGIPCVPAFNREELRVALRRMREKDVIFIDTAGQSHYDSERIKEMRQIIGGSLPIKSHLLLSTVTRDSEMEQVAAKFGELGCSSYIFTKTDETKRRGAIINQILKRKLPISFITNGQRVPEDIINATKIDILKLLF
ncbi:flagellar biosynthesis protein FlhF [Candidatus Magnetomoraceae bacterium gMMP-15]